MLVFYCGIEVFGRGFRRYDLADVVLYVAYHYVHAVRREDFGGCFGNSGGVACYQDALVGD